MNNLHPVDIFCLAAMAMFIVLVASAIGDDIVNGDERASLRFEEHKALCSNEGLEPVIEFDGRRPRVSGCARRTK